MRNGSSVDTCAPGPIGYGGAFSLTFEDSAVGITPGGIAINDITSIWSMSGGVITIPRSTLGGVPPNWPAVGNNWYFFAGSKENEGYSFKITDISADGSNYYITTTLSGGFPGVPHHAQNGLILRSHPGPSVTCSNMAGSSQTLIDAEAIPGKPLFSRLTYTFTGTNANSSNPVFIGRVWGNVVQFDYEVSTAYTGSQGGSITFYAASKDLNYPMVLSDDTIGNYGPTLNARTVGTRTITLAGLQTTPISGDSGLTLPDSVRSWCTQVFTLFITPNMKTEFDANNSVGPVINGTIVTDQGITVAADLFPLAGSFALTGNAVSFSKTTANPIKVHFRRKKV